MGAFLPENLTDGIVRRSAVASTFAASLQLVKEGKANIRQSSAFGPIFVKGKETVANG
jgi:segregation and condensation protein A